MVRIRYILILLLLSLFILPVNANALTGEVKMNCDKTSVVPGEIISCTLTGNVIGGKIGTVSAKISTSSNLTVTSVKPDLIWEGEGTGGKLDLYDLDGKTDSFGIAIFSVKVSESFSGGTNEKIIINDIEFGKDDNRNFISVNDIFGNIKVLSNVNTLSNIKLSSGELSPNFNSDVFERFKYFKDPEAGSVKLV